jgi:hypothetical protein
VITKQTQTGSSFPAPYGSRTSPRKQKILLIVRMKNTQSSAGRGAQSAMEITLQTVNTKDLARKEMSTR